MATAVQRLTAIADALVDGTATTGQKTTFAQAFVDHWSAEIVSLGYDPGALTNEQKALWTVRKIKEVCRDIIKTADTDVSTAQAAVVTAQETAETEALAFLGDEELS